MKTFTFFFFLSLSFILSSCTSTPDFVSSNGVSYYFISSKMDGTENQTISEIWTPEEIEKEEDFLLSLSFEKYSREEILSALSETQVLVVENPIPCGRSKGCNGIQENMVMTVRSLQGPSSSALLHEILHYLQQRRGLVDYQHKSPEWEVLGK